MKSAISLLLALVFIQFFTVFSFAESVGEIAFYSYRDGNYEIYVMHPDGSNQTRLTNNPATDGDPTWSPDGSQIAFHSYRDGNYEIYIMDDDGLKNLTNFNSADDLNPSWSPDGSQIAFTSYRDGNNEIYLLEVDHPENQTNISNNSADDHMPSWSPDGLEIAFNSNREGNFEIFVMDADGSNQTNRTNNSAEDYYPSWSPDGSEIAYVSHKHGNPEIYVNGSRLTYNSSDDLAPSWMPTPESIISALIDEIIADLDGGLEKSLTGKLDNALSQLDKENDSANNMLEAFINQVEALRGKKLTDEQAGYLMARQNVSRHKALLKFPKHSACHRTHRIRLILLLRFHMEYRTVFQGMSHSKSMIFAVL